MHSLARLSHQKGMHPPPPVSQNQRCFSAKPGVLHTAISSPVRRGMCALSFLTVRHLDKCTPKD